MSTTVKTGWLNDKNGDKFAPKTLISQVQTSDGILIEDKIQTDLDAVKQEILDQIGDIDLSTYETKTDAQTKLDEAKSYTDTAISGLATETYVDETIAAQIGGKADSDLSNVDNNAFKAKAEEAGVGGNSATPTLNDLGVTATATELNYVDGVTSNIQTQLNNKAPSEHNHEVADITGTMSVSKGGTGTTAFTSGTAIIGNGTDAFTTRSITNNTGTSDSISGSTNLITLNTLRYAINRTTSVAAADTNYSTYMARGMSLNSSEETPTANGTIAWTYE